MYQSINCPSLKRRDFLAKKRPKEGVPAGAACALEDWGADVVSAFSSEVIASEAKPSESLDREGECSAVGTAPPRHQGSYHRWSRGQGLSEITLAPAPTRIIGGGTTEGEARLVINSRKRTIKLETAEA